MNEIRHGSTVEQQLELPHPIQTPGHDFVMAIALAARMLSAEVRGALKGSGLTEAQLNILLLLKYQFPEGTSQVELSKRVLVNRANVTGLIDRLERDGLARRTSGHEDRRVKWVQITSRGHEVLADAEPAYFRRIRRMAAMVGGRDRETATQALIELCSSLDGWGAER